MVKAPPSTEVFLLWAGYGTINGCRTYPRGRLWLIAESAAPDARLLCRIAWNHPKSGQVVYEDVGQVSGAKIGRKWAEVYFFNGQKLGQVMAPCVCGAGAVGQAGPLTDRHTITPLNPASHERVTIG